MGDVLALMFISVVLLSCGVILLFISTGVWRKLGVFTFLVGLVLLIICLMYLPHAHDHYDLYHDTYSYRV